MQPSFLLSFAFLLFSQLPSVFGVSDENICDAGLNCQYCCRDKQCKSEDDCKGNFQPFVILGAVAGGLIGLFILRKVYVYYKTKQAKANPKRSNQKGTGRSRWRSRSRSKTPKEKKEKKSTKSSKSSKTKATRNTEKEDLYLQVDNESVISPDITIKVEGAKDEESQNSAKNKAEIKSKSEIKSKVEIDDQDQDALVAEKKGADMKNSKADPKKDMKSSASHWTSKKDDMKSSKNIPKDKEKDKKSSSGKDKGRSSRSTSTNKDRGTSQKRDGSKSRGKNDEMKASRRSDKK